MSGIRLFFFSGKDVHPTITGRRSIPGFHFHYRTDSLTDFRIDICSRLAHRIHPLNILYEEV